MPIERAQPLQRDLELRVISPKERMRATVEPQGTGRSIIDGLIPDFHLKWLVLRASPWRLQDISKARNMAERKASLVQISFFRRSWCCFWDFGSDDFRTHLADDFRTIPCRRSSPMMPARVQFSKTTLSTSQGIVRQVRSSALVNFQRLSC